MSCVIKLWGRKFVRRMPPGLQAVITYGDLVALIKTKGQVRPGQRVSHLMFDRDGITYRMRDIKEKDSLPDQPWLR